MDKKLTAVVSGFVALVVAGGVVYFAPSKIKTETVIQPQVERIIERVVEEKLGAIPGTEISGDSFTVNGVRRVSNRIGLNTGSSTLCAIPAPIGSSTPTYFSVKLNGSYGTGTAANQSPVVDLFQSREDRATTTAFASSTTNVIGSPYRPDINSSDAIIVFPGATTTGVAAEEVFVASSTSDSWTFGPQDLNGGSRFDHFVAKISNSPSGDYRGYSPTGYCQAEWIVVD